MAADPVPPSSSTSVNERFNPLPGFTMTMGFTVFYLSIIVLIPIAALFLRGGQAPPKKLFEAAFNPRALASYGFSIWTSLTAAAINLVFGSLMAWVIVRYRFPGRRILEGLIDFPFALPTAVAGLTLADLFSDHGWLGRYLVPLGIIGAYSQLGVVIALTFVGLPFSVRTLEPVLRNFNQDVEEAAASLGAGRLRTFLFVIAPTMLPTMLTGFGLAFARGLGEYGSIVFISGNLPNTEISPMLIVQRLDEFDYDGAIGVALTLMILSFALLYILNRLQAWSSKFQPA